MNLYVSKAKLKNIDAPNKDFYTNIAVQKANINPKAKITHVMYRWNYRNSPNNISVELCHSSGYCIDTTKSRERMANEFSGLNPSEPFYFLVRVLGDKNFHPLVGEEAEINVNFYEP
ncbi:flagellar protein FlhE [Uliginosibacterium sp. TH139]|uniref:flagellar protein FlhE n=1 Tax=Uliginosibacterium sp. TH139 TaxID=2067453 RepID=UPI00117C28F1|nr:flagellar protein FlhE [Uliginosibacterium sp. TH139]